MELDAQLYFPFHPHLSCLLWLVFLPSSKGGSCNSKILSRALWGSQAQSLSVSWISLVWRRQWHPTPVLLPGKSQGRRSLVGCSPWGRKESELDMTERLHFHFSLSCIGEGNGNPLQCSCLENPRDGKAWWAAIYGVTQSRIPLKQLSSNTYIKNGI